MAVISAASEAELAGLLVEPRLDKKSMRPASWVWYEYICIIPTLWEAEVEGSQL
jgi:hypothetical protein